MEPFDDNGEFKFDRRRKFTKMQALYGDDWDDSLEPVSTTKRF